MPFGFPQGFQINSGEPIDNRIIVNLLEDAYEIEMERRYDGLQIYVREEKKLYRFDGGIEDSNLKPDPAIYCDCCGQGGGSMGGGVVISDLISADADNIIVLGSDNKLYATETDPLYVSEKDDLATKDDITNVEQSISTINQNITNIEQNITNVNTSITNIEQRVENIEQGGNGGGTGGGTSDAVLLNPFGNQVINSPGSFEIHGPNQNNFVWSNPGLSVSSPYGTIDLQVDGTGGMRIADDDGSCSIGITSTNGSVNIQARNGVNIQGDFVGIRETNYSGYIGVSGGGSTISASSSVSISTISTAQGVTIKNLVDPVKDYDAVHKAYVDSLMGGGSKAASFTETDPVFIEDKPNLVRTNPTANQVISQSGNVTFSVSSLYGNTAGTQVYGKSKLSASYSKILSEVESGSTGCYSRIVLSDSSITLMNAEYNEYGGNAANGGATITVAGNMGNGNKYMSLSFNCTSQTSLTTNYQLFFGPTGVSMNQYSNSTGWWTFKNAGDPVGERDLVNKRYVDNKIAELEARITALGG